MKKMSWKIKVTIWYTTFFVAIALISMLSIARYSERVFIEEQKDELEGTMREFLQGLEFEGGEYELEDYGFFLNDIMFSIYDKDGKLLEGNVPSDFPIDTLLKHRQPQDIASQEHKWKTYDVYVTDSDEEENSEGIWIRGIMYTTRSSAMEKRMLLMELSVLPILVLIAAGGGYLITRRAFLPVEQIRQTAQQIARGGELSERVPVRKSSGELRRLSQTFNEMLDTIESTFEEEKQFTADASHELRTPIAVIIAESEYGMLDDSTEEERKEALEVILGQSKKMSLLVSQLLAMSRSEHAGRTAQYERVDVTKVIETVVGELREKAAKKQIEVTESLVPEAYVYAEQMGITRIFVNLIDNAIQYGKASGFIKVSLQIGNQQMICKIEDNGIGIKPEHLPNIFKRFYRVDKARTTGTEVHAGLGLSMVQILVKNYGGKIEADSVFGEGTTFTLYFPLYENENIR